MWSITKTNVAAENGENYETYGISRGDTAINDISLDKKDMENFVQILNLFDVSEIHARDIVEDFLGK
ncbi:MAG: DUF6514 family protein [Oscillospiraceae bacterium]